MDGWDPVAKMKYPGPLFGALIRSCNVSSVDEAKARQSHSSCQGPGSMNNAKITT